VTPLPDATGPAAHFRERLVADHLAWAKGLAAGLRRRHSLLAAEEDLTAYAQAGLVEAAARFDPARGVSFTTFAHYRVVGALWDGVRQMGWQPRRRSEACFERGANHYLAELASDQPRGPRAASRLLEERTAALAVIFLAALDGAGPEPADEGKPSALQQLERAQLTIGLRHTLAQLPQRERRLLEGIYYEGRELQAVAAELGISPPWACRLHQRAVERLRELLRTGGLVT
jgi:RNA polymerase sigma factor for flagellar operon FliA